MDMKDIEWRGWQKDLRQYLDKSCDRKSIWVVGKEGNEGKSFFQANIRDEFGHSRVCKLPLSENSRNTFHIMGNICSNKTDIFLFNVGRGVRLDTEQYDILESIKDGEAADGKYMSRQLNFKQPNVLMVFSNSEPEKYKLSMDRWVILKISKDLTEPTDIQGRKLEKRKEQIKHFNAREVEPEKENIDSDASRKRKSSEMEADGQMSAKMAKSINETNQQFGAGRVEPGKEKNPPQENVDEEVEDKYAFNGRLFSRQYKHR